MTGMCRQHKGRLSVAIAGVDGYTPLKQRAHGQDITTRDCLLPGGIHQSRPPDLVNYSAGADPSSLSVIPSSRREGSPSLGVDEGGKTGHELGQELPDLFVHED